MTPFKLDMGLCLWDLLEEVNHAIIKHYNMLWLRFHLILIPKCLILQKFIHTF